MAAGLIAQRSDLGPGWVRSDRPIAGSRPFLSIVTAGQIAAGNVFALLATAPGGPASTAGMTALLAAVPSQPDRFVLAALRGAGRPVEGYFAHSCLQSRSRPS